MTEDNNIEEKLWDYIDGSLSKEELSFVEQLLQTNEAWKSKYSELMDVHQLMQDDKELEHPSLRFTQNVMEEISRLYITPATRNYINKNIIWGIGIFFLTTVVGLFIYTLGQIDWSAPSQGNIPTIDMSRLDWSQFFNNSYMSVFMMVNILLGLMLLDMYLTKRKKEAKG
jgi:hypothetical protein